MDTDTLYCSLLALIQCNWYGRNTYPYVVNMYPYSPHIHPCMCCNWGLYSAMQLLLSLGLSKCNSWLVRSHYNNLSINLWSLLLCDCVGAYVQKWATWTFSMKRCLFDVVWLYGTWFDLITCQWWLGQRASRFGCHNFSSHNSGWMGS